MKLAVLVSGNGTNLQSIIDSVDDGYLPKVQISYVVSSNPEAYALKRAEKKNINTIVIQKKDITSGS